MKQSITILKNVLHLTFAPTLTLLLIFFVGSLTQAKYESKVNTKNGVALNGTDLVEYFKKENNKAIKGLKENSTTYNKVTYYFASKENLNAFKKDPSKYLPAYGGYCAWAIEESSEYVPVDYDSYLIEEDEEGKKRLLLFYNKFFINTKTKWIKKSKKQDKGSKALISKADSNWLKMTAN